MLHFNSFCKASKLTWMRNLYESPCSNPWKIIAITILNEKHNVIHFFEGTNTNMNLYLSNDIKKQCWKEVINTWECYKLKFENTTSEQIIVPNTVIWNTGLIKNNNLQIHYFMSNGLIHLKYIFNYDIKAFKTRQNILE